MVVVFVVLSRPNVAKRDVELTLLERLVNVLKAVTGGHNHAQRAPGAHVWYNSWEVLKYCLNV